MPKSPRITSRYDPTEDDIPRVVGQVERLLATSKGGERCVRDGKLFIELLPEPIGIGPGQCYSITVPGGWDFAVSEGTMEEGRRPRNAKCVASRTEQRWGWIRSALSVLKNATQKIPWNEPGVVYVQVPDADLPVVWLRGRILADEVRRLLQHDHSGISAVVITGEGEWTRKYLASERENAVTTTFYEVIENSNARTPLPKDFQLFGRDFKAR